MGIYNFLHSLTLTGLETQQTGALSGYCVFLDHSLVSWSAKKQSTVAWSSTEAEYRSLAAAELSWLRTLRKDLHIFLLVCPALWVHNVFVISLASNPIFYSRTKHVEVEYHSIWEKVLRRDADVKIVSTQDLVADIFTKGLHPHRFQYLPSKLMATNRPNSLRGIVDRPD